MQWIRDAMSHAYLRYSDSLVTLRRTPVVGDLVHYASHKLVPVGRRFWVQVSGGMARGLWLFADPRFESHFLASDHEKLGQEILARCLKPGDCFYDVGAHVGFFSLIAARQVGSAGQVIAFEPDPGNGSVLRANIEKNKFPQFRVIEAAAWSSSGLLRFERPNAASSGMEGRVCRNSNSRNDRICVTSLALDELVFGQGARPPNFLKMDVEGAESEVLKGSERVFRTCRPLLLCEVHDAANAAFIEPWLRGQGYEVQWLAGYDSYPKQLYASPRKNEFAAAGVGDPRPAR